MFSTVASTFSARPASSCGASANSTFATPATFAAASAAACALWPAISTCTSPPIFAAAATVLSVAAFSDALSCSAITRIVISSVSLQHLGFGLQLLDQRLHLSDLHTGAALGRLDNLQRLQARSHIDTQIFGFERFQRLFLRLHDVRQRHVTRLVQAQIGGDHSGQ